MASVEKLEIEDSRVAKISICLNALSTETAIKENGEWVYKPSFTASQLLEINKKAIELIKEL